MKRLSFSFHTDYCQPEERQEIISRAAIKSFICSLDVLDGRHFQSRLIMTWTFIGWLVFVDWHYSIRCVSNVTLENYIQNKIPARHLWYIYIRLDMRAIVPAWRNCGFINVKNWFYREIWNSVQFVLNNFVSMRCI